MIFSADPGRRKLPAARSLIDYMITCVACGGLTPPGASRTCLHCDAPLRRPSRTVRRLAALLGPAGAILLAACYGGPGRYYRGGPIGPDGATRQDKDHDGAYGPWECVGHDPRCEASLASRPVPTDLDCDDHDPTRYPGAADPDGDGIDQNCDGVDGWRDPAVIVQPDAGTTPIATPPDA